MRILPGAIRPQISLAYLLARLSDTIADTEIVALDRRIQALSEFGERVLGSSTKPLNFGELARTQALPAERVLLERTEDALQLLTSLPPADQEHIRDVLK